MCNLYSMTTNVKAIRAFIKATRKVRRYENMGNFDALKVVARDVKEDAAS